uniref:Casc1_N domain-containing protein n=1 Tax=Mesocestoides corti TaxID=53468 RepID=A0A5K3FRY1_MESCO
MQELRELVQEKVDRACVETLTKASHFADPETSNLQKFWRNNWLSLCIWGNLSKNPRIKWYTFKEAGITFSIPRLLTLSDCAFRIVFMKFDTYSGTSSSAKPREHKSVEKQSSVQSNTGDKPNIHEEEKLEEPKETEEDHQKEDVDVNKIAVKSTVLFDAFDIEDDQPKEEDENENQELMELSEEDLSETPSKLIWDPIPLPEDAIDLCDYHIVGGVFQFDLLKLPRQPKAGRGWRWTNCVVPPRLEPFKYIAETPETDYDSRGIDSNHEVDAVESQVKESDEDKESRPKDETQPATEAEAEAPMGFDSLSTTLVKTTNPDPNPPVEVKLRLPGCLIIPEEPVLACWDPVNLLWRTNRIYINQFIPDLNEISFRTAVFGTFGVFQDFHLNMPFQATPEPSHSAQQPSRVKRSSQTDAVPPPSQPDMTRPSVNLQEAESSTLITPNEEMALGPLPSMGIPEEIYLADKSEADQCLITITGAYIRIHLHVLDDRVAILADDPKAILNPIKIAEEEAAAAAKATGQAADDADDVATAATSRRRGAGTRGSRAASNSAADETSRDPLELEHLTGRWFTPDELISVLKCSGVNLFPRLDSHTRVECIEKNSRMEQRLYEQMALLSPVMAFGWSHWNSACKDPNSFIIMGTEHIDNDGPVDEGLWKVYLMNRKHVYQMQLSESEDKFRSDPEPTLRHHADFYHMYMEIGSAIGKERVQRIQSRYFKTVQRILKSTRLPVFS